MNEHEGATRSITDKTSPVFVRCRDISYQLQPTSSVFSWNVVARSTLNRRKLQPTQPRLTIRISFYLPSYSVLPIYCLITRSVLLPCVLIIAFTVDPIYWNYLECSVLENNFPIVALRCIFTNFPILSHFLTEGSYSNTTRSEMEIIRYEDISVWKIILKLTKSYKNQRYNCENDQYLDSRDNLVS